MLIILVSLAFVLTVLLGITSKMNTGFGVITIVALVFNIIKEEYLVVD